MGKRTIKNVTSKKEYLYQRERKRIRKTDGTQNHTYCTIKQKRKWINCKKKTKKLTR